MGRKRRVQNSAGAGPLPRTWRVGLYIRLSREDAHSGGESESVANQRAILLEHIANLKDGDAYIAAGEYVDDGVSGATDDGREGFLALLEDIRRGRVNCVIVKDLARSFRNYSDQGYYLDDWFPRHKARFISLFHQPLDSYRDPRGLRGIAVPIQGVLNENHCAETSDKVRAVFDMKRRSGAFIGAFAPYGYLKHPTDNNALVIDEEAAATVREIFALFLSGKSKNAIVRTLNGRGMLSPAAYKRETLGLRYENPGLDPARRPLWTASTITTILKNRMYCGDMVQGRYRRKSYKIRVQERVPEAEWYVVPNTHAPLVSREEFQRVTALLGRDTRTAPGQREPYLFAGLLRCADCGAAMARSSVRGHVYYYCRTYKDQSKTACGKHALRHEALEAAVLCALRLQLYLGADCAAALAAASGAPPAHSRAGALRNALAHRERELARSARYRQAAWQDWKDGAISAEEYRRLRADYEGREQELARAMDALREELAALAAEPGAEPGLVKELRECGNIRTLTRDVLVALVEDIRVYEGGEITIRFAFCDPLGAAGAFSE